jgi:Fe-S-cluster-containing dehydrogenase component
MNRRNFLSLAATVGAISTTSQSKAEEIVNKKEFVAVLNDTTRCIGCRACEKACAEAHGFEVPNVENDNALETTRNTSEARWTVVNRFQTEKGPVFVKKQCLHCWQPACASACLTNAMYKTQDGPVIWRPNKCMGCRYCMVACPFSIPKFEYNSWNPKIQKCSMCWERLEQGKKPACVEACPVETLMFGKKRELMEIARVRIYNHPTKYVRQVYGELEVGGTGWLYLSAVPFEQLGFKTDLGTTPYPEYTKEFLYGVPLVLFGAPALLLGLRSLAEKSEDEHE